MKKLSDAQRAALALLPLPAEDWVVKVRETTRKALLRRGLVRVGRLRRYPQSWDYDPRPDAPLVAYTRTRMLPASYRAMQAVARDLGWPRDYKHDLHWWDREYILTNNPEAFGWVIRQSGSHLAVIDPDSASSAADWVRAVAQSHPPIVSAVSEDLPNVMATDHHWRDRFFNGAHYYLWADNKLTEMTPEKLILELDQRTHALRVRRGNRLDIPDYAIFQFVGRRYHVREDIPVQRNPDDTVATVSLAVPRSGVWGSNTVQVSRGPDFRLRID